MWLNGRLGDCKKKKTRKIGRLVDVYKTYTSKWNGNNQKFTALHFINVFFCFIYMPSDILYCNFMALPFYSNSKISVRRIFKYVIWCYGIVKWLLPKIFLSHSSWKTKLIFIILLKYMSLSYKFDHLHHIWL
jgi:hypothetical protein